MLEWMYNADTVANEIHSGTIWQFVEINGRPSGYISVTPEAQKLYASKIYLSTAWQGRGIGQRLLKQIERIAYAFGLGSIYLFVNRENEKAVAAYKRAGFEVTATRVKQLEQGYVMDDYVMTLELGVRV